MTALNTRFGGLPVRVAMPPVFAAYAMDSANALESLLCILRASGVALFLDGELSIENCACLANCHKINKFKLYGINPKRHCMNGLIILVLYSIYR